MRACALSAHPVLRAVAYNARRADTDFVTCECVRVKCAVQEAGCGGAPNGGDWHKEILCVEVRLYGAANIRVGERRKSWDGMQ